MLFNSIKFILFAFIVYSFYYSIPQKFKKLFLLGSSYVFYGAWNWKFLSLLVISTVVDFYCGKRINQTNIQKAKKKYLVISLFTNLGILGFFKYYNFFAESFYEFFQLIGIKLQLTSLNIILPVGISFYTFQTLSYTIDIYRGKMKHTESFIDFATYVAFFPQLVAGPIERAKQLLPQIRKPHQLTPKYVWEGINLVTIGFAKKVLISDQISYYVDDAFSNWRYSNSSELLIGLVLFSFQIYYDFSGYSDIARGLAKFFGINLMVNFRQPYLSLDITEFWRRWHISLSTWLRDYLYIPLGGNRKGKWRTYINLMTTMLLGGLWHGASWNFIFWGALHGIYLAVHRMIASRPKIHRSLNLTELLKNVHKIIITYILVLITWLPFRAQSFSDMKGYLNGLLTFKYSFTPEQYQLIFLLILFMILIDLPLYLNHDHILKFKKFKSINAINVIVTMILVVVILIQQRIDKPFIYFQF